jgi:hypothetical protein
MGLEFFSLPYIIPIVVLSSQKFQGKEKGEMEKEVNSEMFCLLYQANNTESPSPWAFQLQNLTKIHPSNMPNTFH